MQQSAQAQLGACITHLALQITSKVPSIYAMVITAAEKLIQRVPSDR